MMKMESKNKSSRGRKPKTVTFDSVFPKRLRELIENRELTKNKKLTLPELAEHLNTTRQSIGQWKNGDTLPNVEMLKSIAEYFNVSADFLVGIENETTHKATNIKEETGLSSENIEWLSEVIEKHKQDSEEYKQFFGIFNSLLAVLKEKNVIETLVRLSSQYKQIQPYLKQDDKIVIDKSINLSGMLSLLEDIQKIDSERIKLIELLDKSILSIIGYSKEEYDNYCNQLSRPILELIQSVEKDYGIEMLIPEIENYRKEKD